MILYANLMVKYDDKTIKPGDMEEMEIHLKNHIDSLIDNGSIDLAPNTNASVIDSRLEVTRGD